MPELVVIAEQLLAPVPGGTGRYTAELLRALAETAPPGWEVTGVVARRPKVQVEGLRMLPLPPRALVAAWQLGVPYWPGGDAVHAPTPLAPPRGSVSVTVHDTVPWTYPETLTRRGVSWHRQMIRRAAGRARGLVVPTRAVADDLRRWVPVTVPVHVAGHGVAEVLSSPEEVPDLPGRFVLAVGTIEPRKGIDVLLDAMTEVDVPLVLVGQPGWGGVDPRRDGVDVRVLGRLSDARLAGVLRRASVLAVPSLAEGFGLPLLEAMAAGVPVVHSDAPALVEVAGGAGMCVPRGDAKALAAALREVLSSPVSALVTAGRARAAEFSWRRAAEAVWTIHAGTRL
ncbi:glycosyltransferase involved in cell wall biosynthesis [Amycolatopsis bartoniae]|uniref:glycosyltransferase family 4 protein n=1 Tax=Amycolatopsis bartoniae TaxID=941986 RepID=UPI001194222A|nr:glycosyltransferase family 1 protein [Amycolatopsis bartoniae]MBB2937298.1 glycosyltransferase involved in cell wall biosynthesis [Amycolatopsis bartoniae]TVT07938.1 glycosyltransferase family 4 protein [Amycolatopsis bartoniae]